MRSNIIIALLILLGPIAQAQESLAVVQERVSKAWNTVRALRADVTIISEMPTGADPVQAAGKGLLEYHFDGEVGRYRQTMSITLPPPIEDEAKLEVLFDGQSLYMVNEVMGQKAAEKHAQADISSGVMPPGGAPLLAVLQQRLDLKVLPDANVTGQMAFVLEGTPKEPLPVQRVVVYIDKRTGMQLKAELYEGGEKPGSTVTYTNIRMNPQLTAEHFTYTGPPPVEVE
jgi:hypothetical protein